DPGEPPAPTEDPVNALLTRLQKRRDPLQKEVFAALADLEKARVLEEMREFFLPFVPVRGKKRIRVSLCGIPPVAADRIGKCLVDVRQYESWVHNPDAAYEHHALRIATKKLRYTMEYYAPVYRRRFAKPLARIKRLQDLLGDIHDCDVWIDQVTIAIIKQRTHEHSPKERSFASVSSVAPLRRLLVNREKRRARLYRQFVRFWDQLVRTRFWDEVRQTILSGQKSVFLHRETGRKKEERESFSLLSSSVPGQEVHAGIVAHLAGRLFDELQSLHRLSPRDRDLLAYAALVHDIGWKYGDEGHQKKSAEMILSSGYLPVPLFEQAIIALAAGLHGGNTKVRLPGIYSLLPGADKARVRALGALLRVADGLDYTRAGRVTDLKCTIRESEVDCELMVSADAGAEMIRATKKSDLFSDVFKRPLVIL
ncbi:MAG: CHAD domain-containing protein, partial [Methanoregula sp.]|nr:CHAD domain-containing protein [Methanoregula sp.]